MQSEMCRRIGIGVCPQGDSADCNYHPTGKGTGWPIPSYCQTVLLVSLYNDKGGVIISIIITHYNKRVYMQTYPCTELVPVVEACSMPCVCTFNTSS